MRLVQRFAPSPWPVETVRDRGTLKCGVKESQRGFGFLEPDGSYSGSDVEFCRAVAAAVLGDAGAVEFVPASAADRFELLDSGEIDVLIRTTTWTSGRDTSLNGSFAQITFYDGQGILVRSESDFQSLTDLQGATICVTGGTTTEANLEDRLSAANVAYTALTFEGDPEILAAFSEGRCDAWTADKSNLVGQRAGYPKEDGGPDAVRILGVTLSKEPLGPVTRDGDTEWFDIVNWTVLGMIAAEELGVSSGNVAAQASNPSNIDIAPPPRRWFRQRGRVPLRRRARDRQHLHAGRPQPSRQLRRGLRAHNRTLGPGASRHAQRALDQRRPPLRTADQIGSERRAAPVTGLQ